MILDSDIQPGTVIKVRMPRHATSLQFVAVEPEENITETRTP